MLLYVDSIFAEISNRVITPNSIIFRFESAVYILLTMVKGPL